jgi:hypothetical protein
MNPGSSRRCGSCGEALPEGAAFCRACGARYEQPTCDSCRAPVVPGTAFCRSCGAALAAGAGDAKAGAGAAAAPPAPEPTAVRPAPPPLRPSPSQPPPPTPPRAGARRTPLLIAAAVVLLGAGAAAAIVLTGGESGPATTTVAAESGDAPAEGGEAEAVETEEADPEEIETEETEAERQGVPPVSRTDMETAIESVLLTYHEDVVERDFRSAWALLSARKRQQNLDEYGYPEWMRAQASLSDDLSPFGLQAQIDALEGDGVARVLVTGMSWSAPGSPCSEWSGLTWVRYEGGEWTYDPGYSTTAARRDEWERRADELLGAGC